MGWNTGYTIFEATVVGAYDLGKLDKELLAVLMEPYRGTDIDSGGSEDLESKDGKGVEQIVVETFGLSMPEKPAFPQPKTWDESPENEAWEAYLEAVGEKFNEVTEHYGWR